MGMLNRILAARLLAAGLWSGSALLATSSSAMMLGGLSLHSYLGQPLRATVSVRADEGEQLDIRCFTLVRPEQPDDFTYLTQARLALDEANGQLQLKISSQQAIGDPFVRLSIRANCGQGNFSRVFTVLLDPAPTQTPARPDPNPAPTPAPVVAAATDTELHWDVRDGETLQSIVAGLYPGQSRMQRRMIHAIRSANAELVTISAHSPLPADRVLSIPSLKSVASRPEKSREVRRRMPALPDIARPVLIKPAVEAKERPLPESKAAAEQGTVRLKLSSEGLDLSSLGSMSDEQRQLLREKQHLQDVDDQVATVLSMKNRIMQLEADIGELQAALANTNKHLVARERPSVAAANRPPPPSSATGGSSSGWMGGLSLLGVAGVGLALVLLASGWWWWRRRQIEARRELQLGDEFSSDIRGRATQASLSAESSPAALPAQSAGFQEDELYHDVTGIFSAADDSVTLTEADTVLDEADLYLAYGWITRAIDLLQEYLEKHPDDVQLWKKLFEIYSAERMKSEFEKLALQCLATMDDSALWVLVQKLGRQLDAGNPLYFSGQDVAVEKIVSTMPADIDDQPLLEQQTPASNTPLEFVIDEKLPEPPLVTEIELDEPDTTEISNDTQLHTSPVPGLDAPLEFIFDEKLPELSDVPEEKQETAEPAQESERAEFLPPLFPEFETPKNASEDESGGKKA